MKILHVVGGELSSGASIGALNLHEKLLKNNIKSFILTNSKNNTRKKTHIFFLYKNYYIRNFIYTLINYLPKLFYNLKKNISFTFNLAGHDITKLKIYKEADIIHLHWIGKSIIDIDVLPKIRKPIVWTFRDMWPMTGGCHYTLSCNNYKKTCGNCPQLNSNEKHDLSYFSQKKKIKIIKKIKNIHYVTVSNWLKKKALESKIFKQEKVNYINNTINCDFFKKISIHKYKNLNINKEKKILLYGAQNVMAQYKGFEIFIDSLKYLNKEKFHLLIFGKIWDFNLLIKSNVKYDYLGYIENKKLLRDIYSLADIFIAPSIQDAFPKTFAEAMLCETPVVCFENNSISDVVRHKKEGYIAKKLSPQDLAKGISWVAKNQTDKMNKECRKHILQNYNSADTASSYINLYKRILNLKNEY